MVELHEVMAGRGQVSKADVAQSWTKLGDVHCDAIDYPSLATLTDHVPQPFGRRRFPINGPFTMWPSFSATPDVDRDDCLLRAAVG